MEIGLVKHVEKFLVEMGAGFAFMGRQYHINVSGDDYYIDILMYNTFLHRYLWMTFFAVKETTVLSGYCFARVKTALRLNMLCVIFRSLLESPTMN